MVNAAINFGDKSRALELGQSPVEHGARYQRALGQLFDGAAWELLDGFPDLGCLRAQGHATSLSRILRVSLMDA